MPVIYIHGVNVRDPAFGIALRESVERWIWPAVAPAAGQPLTYLPVFWGDIASDFRWNLASRPRTSILRQGGDAPAIALVRTSPRTLWNARIEAEEMRQSGPLVGGSAELAEHAILDLTAVAPDRRADLLSDLYLASVEEAGRGLSPEEEARVAPAAARVAEDWDGVIGSDSDRLATMLDRVDAAVTRVAAAGASEWVSRAGELGRRALAAPGDILSTFLAETRPALNTLVAQFFGDVLTYLSTRGSKGMPGPIPQRVLEGLRAAVAEAPDEPVVVITHSMGGQLLYDAVTIFMDGDPTLEKVRIAHWISCACQVSFFAELGQFPGADHKARAPGHLPRPPRVDAWTNFYDPNDFFGFVMNPVFEGVQDQEYHTGYGLALAHTGYLTRPSFFERIAGVLRS